MISNTDTKWIYNGDGSTTVFQYANKIFAASDLTVILKDTTTGVETTQTLNVDYTVSNVGSVTGGNVTFVTAPVSGKQVIIYIDLALTQETDYVPNDPFPAESHEEALDRLTLIAQQLQEQIDRVVIQNITETSNLEMPTLSSGKFLTNDGTSLDWGTPTGTDYNADISYGLDADKSASPSKGDIYIATDTSKYYVCYTSGSWTEVGGSDVVSGCSVYLSANQSITANTVTTVNLDTVDWDYLNEFDTSTHKFTVTNAGKYLIVGGIGYYVTADGDTIGAAIYKNGAGVKWTRYTVGGALVQSFQISCILDLSASDYIELKGINVANDDTIYGSSYYTYLHIMKLV